MITLISHFSFSKSWFLNIQIRRNKLLPKISPSWDSDLLALNILSWLLASCLFSSVSDGSCGHTDQLVSRWFSFILSFTFSWDSWPFWYCFFVRDDCSLFMWHSESEMKVQCGTMALILPLFFIRDNSLVVWTDASLPWCFLVYLGSSNAIGNQQCYHYWGLCL